MLECQTCLPSGRRRGVRALLVASTIGGGGATPWAPPTPCAQAEDDARHDSQHPAEHGARKDDPDEGGVPAPDRPARLDLARVRDHERDQGDQERNETERPTVQPGAVAVSPEPFTARLESLDVRRRVPRW